MLRTPSTALAAALVLSALATAPSARAADVHWFYDGQSQGQYEPRCEDNEYRYGRHGERAYIPRPDYSVYRPESGYDADGYGRRHHGLGGRAQFSCLEGVESLKQAGFRHIEVVDCANGSYVYDAVRQRVPWRIEVSRASGGIVNLEPLGE
jgi:hypothetical protein